MLKCSFSYDIYFISGILGLPLDFRAYANIKDADTSDTVKYDQGICYTCMSLYSAEPSRKHAYIILTPLNPTYI